MDGNQQLGNEVSWQYTPEATPQSVAVPPTGAEGSITWTASEFIAHDKSVGWFGVLATAAIVAAALIWFITKDVVSGVAIVVAAAMLAAFARRQPRELTYRIDGRGLQVAERHYAFKDYRSFSVLREGAFDSISFTPLKRFAPLLTIYFDPRDEDKIADLLKQALPYEPRKADLIDRLMWRIRF